jgi:Protein of unknown function (DUF2726)
MAAVLHQQTMSEMFALTNFWMVAVAAFLGVILAVAMVALWKWGSKVLKRLPKDWALTPRPVFSSTERHIYRLLREALPHHVILSKLPLVRFCQSADPYEVRYWFDLLGAINVTFALCSPSGRVLAVIDMDNEGGTHRRSQKIKVAVLNACRVRYLRYPPHRLPTVTELQSLIPATRPPAPLQTPMAGSSLNQARDTLASTVANRRAQRAAPSWQDSSFSQDSFFAPDSRLDGITDFGPLSQLPPLDDGSDDIAGVVVDTAPNSAQRP